MVTMTQSVYFTSLFAFKIIFKLLTDGVAVYSHYLKNDFKLLFKLKLFEKFKQIEQKKKHFFSILGVELMWV